MMPSDNISLEVKKDLLIVQFGEPYLKKHKREHMVYACSNRMRELSRLLNEYRLFKSKGLHLMILYTQKIFEVVILAVWNTSGYGYVKRTFLAPSLACMHLYAFNVEKGYQCQSIMEAAIKLKNVKTFKKLVESHWTIEWNCRHL